MKNRSVLWSLAALVTVLSGSLSVSTALASGGVIRQRGECLRLLTEAGILNDSIRYVKVKGITQFQDDYVLVESPARSRGGELRIYSQSGSRTQNLQQGSCGRSDRTSISDRIKELLARQPSNVRRSDQSEQALRDACRSGYGIDHPEVLPGKPDSSVQGDSN